MITDAKEELAQIVKELKCSGFCSRCILRYINVKEIPVFKSIDSVKMAIAKHNDETIDNELPKSKKEKLNPCVACCGILQDLCDEAAVSDILTNIKQADYQFEEFVLALSIPLRCILHEHIAQVYLKRKYPKVYADKQPSTVKEVWKWIMGSIIEQEFRVAFNVFSQFDIIVTAYYENDAIECEQILRSLEWSDSSRNNNLSRAKVERAITEIEDEKILRCAEWPPSIPNSSAKYKEVRCSHKSLFLAGRYNKYSRKLSQTPWIIDGEKLMETSIKELICEKLETYFKADDVKFSASGREDVDVRTLGKGRPFVLEFLNPRRVFFTELQMKQYQMEINQSTKDIAVRDLQIVSRDEIAKLKMGEEEKTKTYSALCFSRKPITAEDLNVLKNCQSMTIRQKTPIRVLHRRPLAVRERIIHEIEAKIIDPYHFNLHLTTQAGTYIKEFVHGDFGRTEPSLGTILKVETDILELDVESIQLDWPPSLKD